MRAVGLDIGTTSISAVVVDALSGKTEKAYTIANDSFLPSAREWEKLQNPEKIKTKVLHLLDTIIEEFSGIGVIGLTGQMHGIVYLNQKGECVSPLYTWQDGRGNLADAAEKSLCDSLQEKYGMKAFTGYGLITHLYNVQHNMMPKDAASICTIMDYIGICLSKSEKAIIHSSNAASFGFYQLEKNEFFEDILESEGVNVSILPEITDTVSVLGSYQEIPVCLAIGDNQASFLGSIRCAKDEILVNMGTGGQVSLWTTARMNGEDIEMRPFMENSYLAVGASLCGGRAYAILASFFKNCASAMGVEKFDPYSFMKKMLEETTTGNGLLVDTRFSGTREHLSQRGLVKNIGIDNFTPQNLTYGVLGGMVQELYGYYKTMREGLGIQRKMIVASGNGMRKNEDLQRIASEKFQMTLRLADRTEEAACGAALAGLHAIGYRSWREMLGVEELYNHKTLEERAKKFNGELNLDGEFQWGESVGREVW